MMAMLLASAAASGCSLPAGWDAVAARSTPAIVFGELHGTREAPAMVGEVACALATRRRPILVAVELFSSGDAAFQAAWRGPEAGFAEALLAGMSDWKPGHEGGPASQALLAMLVRLHALKVRGAPIDVVVFTGPRGAGQRARFAGLPGQGPYEAMQAENIRAAAASKRYARVIVLVGDLHARKQPVTRAGASFDPMASILARSMSVTSLVLGYDGGEAFNCVPKAGVEPVFPIMADMLDCSAHPAGRRASLGAGPGVALADAVPPEARPDPAYDGVFYVGAITASPPAIPAAR